MRVLIRNFMAYTEEQISDFLALAQEVGITKAKRELGYPASWSTAQYWAKNRGVEVSVDEVMAKASNTNQWYKTEEVITIAQEGMNRLYDELVNNNALTADEQKKLAEAFVKHYGVWANAQGKATSIVESRETDSFEAHVQAMIAEERGRNSIRKEKVTE